MIDLKKEQKASLARKRYKYSFIAKVFFLRWMFLPGKKLPSQKRRLSKR